MLIHYAQLPDLLPMPMKQKIIRNLLNSCESAIVTHGSLPQKAVVTAKYPE